MYRPDGGPSGGLAQIGCTSLAKSGRIKGGQYPIALPLVGTSSAQRFVCHSRLILLSEYVRAVGGLIGPAASCDLKDHIIIRAHLLSIPERDVMITEIYHHAAA